MISSRAYFTNDCIRVSGETIKAEHERKRMAELRRGLLLIHHFAACSFVDVFKKAAITRNANGIIRRVFLPLWRKKRGALPQCLSTTNSKVLFGDAIGGSAHALFTKHQVLASLPNNDIEKLVRTMHICRVRKDPATLTLIRQGTVSDFAYFVTAGTVTRSDGMTYEAGEWVGQQACDSYDNFINEFSYVSSSSFECLALEIRRIKLIISPDSKKRVLHQLSRSRRYEYMYNKGIQLYELGLYKFFKNWDDSMLLRISASFEPVTLTALDYVYKQGNPAKYLYLLEHGEATGYQQTMHCCSVLHNYVSRDTIATEDIALGCDYHSTSVQVVRDSNLWKISSDVVLPMLASSNYNFNRLLKHELAFRVTRRNGFHNRVPIQLLLKCAAFIEWPKNLLQELQKEFKPVVYCAGDVIVGKREESHSTFVVTHGEAIASIGESGGRFGSQIRLGDGIGFWECLLGVTYRETIQSKTVLEGYAISTSAIRAACATCYPLPLDWSRRMQSAAISWCNLCGESAIADRINVMKNNDFLGQYLTPAGFIQKKTAKIRDTQKMSISEAKEVAERELLMEQMKEHLKDSPLGRLDLDAVRREMIAQATEPKKVVRPKPMQRSPRLCDEVRGKRKAEGLFAPADSHRSVPMLTKIPSPPKLSKATHSDMIAVKDVRTHWTVRPAILPTPPTPPPYAPMSRRLAKEVPRLTPTKKLLPQIHFTADKQYVPQVPVALSHLAQPRARSVPAGSTLMPTTPRSASQSSFNFT